ncbi:MAG TPA: glycosyltransferase family 4 protein [Trebonia sp.]|jgi:glycosyltransferase involved in cell wall biosynthesis
MNNQLRFVTLSKYPPYRSGHAKQALWNNTALAVLTEAEQHQVTYCGESMDPQDDAGAGVRVHHVKEVRGNRRVPDGHLLRAVAAELYRVTLENDIDVVNTYYIDPHAAIANRVADALALLGRRPVVIHSIEGSDVLESVCEHLTDGSAGPLFGDVMRGDVLCTVSHYTARRFLAGAEEIGGARLADTIAESVVLRYPGLPPAAFAQLSPDALAEFRHRSGLRQDSVLISTLGRLEEEKGLDTLMAVAGLAAAARPEFEFVIAGTGSLGDQLVEQARTVPNMTVLRNISSHDAQCLRAASAAGVFPTRIVPGFIETFCVAALEYEAVGVPVLASAIGGVPEATPDFRFLVAPDTAPAEWLARIDDTLACRAERSAVAADYAGRFTSARSAQRLIDLATLAAARLNRGAPLKADPVDDYLAAWPAADARVAEPAQM